ncbi:Trafficking protein particle complex subunit BET5 [Cystobasidiomycetes sp. EMM_F5]
MYIFDRHCACVYFQSWHRSAPLRAGKDVLIGVAPEVSLATNPAPDPSSNSTQSGLKVEDVKTAAVPPTKPTSRGGLPFDEEAKLVYGILSSVRNMAKKLSGKDDEAFLAYKTSTYKLHLFETPSGFKFVLFSDPNVDSLRNVLRSIYQSAFIEFVVRNPMVEMDSAISGKGIDNHAFRTAVHNFISGLGVYR